MFYNCPATYLNIAPAIQYFIILTWTEFSINPFKNTFISSNFIISKTRMIGVWSTTTTLIPASQA